MGIFIEEIINYNRDIINNISESTILLEDYLDLLCEQCNDIFEESYKEDMKISKEDLMNPNKLNQILKRLEREKLEPTKKEKIAFNIVMGITILLAGTTITGLSVLLIYDKIAAAFLFYIVGLISTLVTETKLLNRFTTLNNFSRVLKKVEECKNKLEEKINNTDNEKERKQLEQQLKSLNNIETKIQDAKTRVFEIYNNDLKNNKPGAVSNLDNYLKTKKDKINYIKRLKECIKNEKDIKMKKSMQDHLKRVEEFRTDEEVEKEWWR